MHMESCEFCRIVRGQQAARVVFETTETMAFFPLAPAIIGHTLVIPKTHKISIWSLTDPEACRLLTSALSVARGIQRALQPDGLNIINSNGSAASQSVAHMHIHLVPRWHDDSFGAIWPHSEPIARDIKDNAAHLIRQACQRQV